MSGKGLNIKDSRIQHPCSSVDLRNTFDCGTSSEVLNPECVSCWNRMLVRHSPTPRFQLSQGETHLLAPLRAQCFNQAVLQRWWQ